MSCTFKVRVSRDKYTITSVPKEYSKEHRGFMGRLPKALASRSRDFAEKFFGDTLDNGSYSISIEPDRNGAFIVGAVTRGNRKTETVHYHKKCLINRKNGLAVRMCFLPEEYQGKRVSVEID